MVLLSHAAATPPRHLLQVDSELRLAVERYPYGVYSAEMSRLPSARGSPCIRTGRLDAMRLYGRARHDASKAVQL